MLLLVPLALPGCVMAKAFLWLLLVVFGSSSFAAGTVSVDTSRYEYVCGTGSGQVVGPSWDAACKPALEAEKARYSDPYYGNDKSWMYGGPFCATDVNAASGGCSGHFRGGGAGILYVSVSGTRRTACPANATKTGTSCICNDGYKPDAEAKACIPDCTAKQTVSSGYYNIGANQGAAPRLLGCKGLCEVIFDGTSPAGSALVGGVKNWFAKGEYIATGGACPASMAGSELPQTQSTVPEDTCAPGDAKGQLNGKTVCVKQTGLDAGKQTDESKPKEKTTVEKTVTTNPDGSTTTTETTTKTDKNGNTEKTVVRTTTRPDGSITTERETQNPLPPSTGQPGEPDKDKEKTKCELNSSDAGCGGDPAGIGSLYSAKDKTMSGVLTGHTNAIKSSAFGSAVGGFFSVSGGGSCPTFSQSLAYFKTTITLDQFCSPFATTALALFKAALLLVASFFAFRVAVE